MGEKNFGLIVSMFILFCSDCRLSNADDDNSRQTFVIRYKDGEQTIPVTVVLDYKKQTEYVINMNPRTPAKSVTLYDFKQRTIAYKDLTNRECFLGRLTHETLTEESSALHDVQSPVESKPKVRSLDPERPALTPTEIRNIAGQKTAIFCRKMNTWLLMPEKNHGINKRNVDEYEERTYEHHGTHTVQYSRYGKETRRRFRNPNSWHRPHRRQSAANTINPRSGILKQNHFAENPSANDIGLNVANYNDSNIINPENNLSINKTSDGFSQAVDEPYALKYPSNYGTYKAYENVRSSLNKMDSNESDVHGNHSGYQISYPNFKAEFASSPSASNGNAFMAEPDSKATDNMRPKSTDEILTINHEIVPEYSKEHLLPTDKQNSLAKINSKDSVNVRTERATSTTDIPSAPHNVVGNPSQIHPSLQYLLPLYKPLTQEFNFDPPYINENETLTRDSNARSIESEFHPIPALQKESEKNGFIANTDHNDSSENPDVSTNVLEVQKIRKQFENVNVIESYTSLPLENNRHAPHHNYLENYRHTSQENSNDTYFHKNYSLGKDFPHVEQGSFYSNSNEDDLLKNNHSNKNPSEIFSLESFTTTEVPAYTNRKYFQPEKPLSFLSPVFHSPFENTEDLSSFQILPHHVLNTHHDSVHSENNLPARPLFEDVTTQHPISEEKFKISSRHRSDIPSDDSDNKFASFNSALESETRNATHFPFGSDGRTNYHSSSVSSRTANESFPPYQIKYQSVLRDFKPDEIVIDIENVPTQPPPPVTSDFQQRKLEVQPSAKSSPENDISDADRRGEQTTGTTWRSFIPTSTPSRRRLNDRNRRPVKNGINSHSQNSLMHQNHHQFIHVQRPNQINQLNRVHGFQQVRFSNRPQAYYSSRVNPPHRTRIPSQLNQVQHFNQLGNLPPGVSMHPRHPHAPYADMVLSNRPPTMPLITDHRTINKPHRQRHHRNKEHLKSSCCRLRGKPGSFQSCCRNGGPCCSGSRRQIQTHGASCCSSVKADDQVIPSNQIHPSLRNDEMHRSASKIHDKERCQKEKMCRTLYESTQKVMVCRNAHIEGC